MTGSGTCLVCTSKQHSSQALTLVGLPMLQSASICIECRAQEDSPALRHPPRRPPRHLRPRRRPLPLPPKHRGATRSGRVEGPERGKARA